MKTNLTNWHEKLLEMQRMCGVSGEKSIEIDIHAGSTTVEVLHWDEDHIIHGVKRTNLEQAVEALYNKIIKTGIPWDSSTVERRDYNGKVLRIGDTVIFTHPNYRSLVTGEVIKFTPKMVRVRYVRNLGYMAEYLSEPNFLIKKN